MFMNRYALLTACVGLALLAGCDKSAPTGSSTESAEPAAAVEKINPAVVLAATPNPVDFCNGKKLTAVTVKWDVTAAAISNYSIWVEAPSIPRKLWVSSVKRDASKDTGPWVRENTKFSMTDTTGTVIATTTVTAADCGASGETVPAPADAAPSDAAPVPTETTPAPADAAPETTPATTPPAG